jgi:HPt (histidine-containing phosphotransfer) domain-containing protein
MTAHAMTGYKERCLAAGMDGYITKPVRHDLLLRALGEIQNEREAGSKVSRFEKEDLVQRLMGDGELARRVAGAFVDSMPKQLAALAAAIGNSDAQATAVGAHSIKGMAANAGCPQMRDLASRMEELGKSGALETASGVLHEFTAAFEAVKPTMQRFRSQA